MMILESLDSLWFFSNILLPSSPAACIKVESAQGADLAYSPKTEQPPPSAQILKQHQILTADNTVSEEQKTEPEINDAPTSPVEANKEQRRKKSNHKQSTARACGFDKEVKVVKLVLDLGLSLGDLGSDGRSSPTLWKHRRMTELCGPCRPVYCCNMPPPSDALAMKEHLKSWAHAVACTVR